MTTKSVNNVRAKPAVDPKGKGKETTIVKPSKPTATSTSTTSNARAPLRTVTGRTRPNTVKTQKEETTAAHPPAKAVPVVEIPTATYSRTTSRVKASTSTTATTATRRSAQKKTVVAVDSDVEVLEEPFAKRRRTSSEVGDDALLENIVEESEPVDAGVENIGTGAVEDIIEQEQDWDDLDRDDDDDPLMVSEYVADIFNYLKVVEVRRFTVRFPIPKLTDFFSKLLCPILITWITRRSSRGRCVESSWTG